MRCEIWFKGSEDWGTVGTEEFLAKNFAADPEDFAHRVREWNQKFSIGYTLFRAAVRDIAVKNWQRMGCRILSEPSCRADSYYLFTDDDDWFNPLAPVVLEPIFKQNSHIEVVAWQGWNYHVVNAGYQGGRADLYHRCPIITSNGFAIRGSVGVVHPPVGRGLHQVIEDWPSDKVVRIPDALSIWVRHPAACCSLRHQDIASILNSTERSEMPDCLSWAKLEIESLFRLVQSIEHR